MAEVKTLIPAGNVESGANNKPEASLIQRLMLNVDKRVSVKLLIRTWRPRLEFVVRLMLVSTFLDDSLRVAMHPADQLGGFSQGFLGWLYAAFPGVAVVVAGTILLVGLAAQLGGSLCLLALYRTDVATAALISWSVVQPILYGQVSNSELVTESLTLIGGLLLLRVHYVGDGTSSLTHLLGRLLLPVSYLHFAGRYLLAAEAFDETSNLSAYVASLSLFAINVAVVLGLVAASALVAAGLKSRVVALALALINLGIVLYQHPFFLFVGRWTGVAMWNPHVLPARDALYDFDEGATVNSLALDPAQVFDLHRFYFFLGLSTSGALLLLAQFGPGEIAVQKGEVLLPVVARAQD